MEFNIDHLVSRDDPQTLLPELTARLWRWICDEKKGKR
jgi:hypothetical protein